MKKIAILAGLLLFAMPALAAVTVTTAPVSLVTSPSTLGASSTPLGLFSFSLAADAAETLSSVSVTINNAGTSTAVGSHLASVAVFRDNNSNGTLEPTTDLLSGTTTTVNVGTATLISTTANNSLPGTFFVTLSTSSSWSATSPADSVTVTLAANGISTSANSPTVTAVTTNTITASAPVDTTGPVLTTAVLNATSPQSAVLTFGEATNSAAISAANINSVLMLSNSHSWLDGALAIGSATWSTDAKTLTITLSSATSAPTVAVGDTVTVAGSVIKDATGNNATGTATITAATTTGGGGDDEDNDDGQGKSCGNSLINGRLYKIADSTTVYLAAHCILRPFRGAAVFHARGNKFQNIITLSALPTASVTTEPALPAVGTLIKGSDKTIWFVESGHKRKGFASAQAFLGLGFNFNQVSQIADSDLQTMPVDSTAVTTTTQHPDGALVKCTSSPTIAQVSGSTLVPFANVESFTLRGHTFQQVATINCAVFHYVSTAPVNQ